MSRHKAERRVQPQTPTVLPAGDQAMQTVTPTQMLAVAVQGKQPLDYIRELMQLEREWKADIAREAFYEAMAEFKKEPIEVLKDKINKQYESQYSSIGNLVNTVNSAMAPFGLNARFDFDQSDGIRVTCILSHTLGHSIEVPLKGPLDSSGNKNPLQQLKSTITYLSGATYQAVTGVIAIDDANLDDDGNGAGAKKKTISEAEEKELDRLIRLTNTDQASILEWAGVGKLDDFPFAKYNEARDMLMRRKRKQDKELRDKEAAQ